MDRNRNRIGRFDKENRVPRIFVMRVTDEEKLLVEDLRRKREKGNVFGRLKKILHIDERT